MNYNFEWDPGKARENCKKHGVRFEQATTVFMDPRALSVYDNEHSDKEDRWITLGLSAGGSLLIVHHTFTEINEKNVRIRIFSSRKAGKHEIEQYTE